MDKSFDPLTMLWIRDYGDVHRDGSICEGTIVGGVIWVTKEQSKRAKMFGWKILDHEHNDLVLISRVAMNIRPPVHGHWNAGRRSTTTGPCYEDMRKASGG